MEDIESGLLFFLFNNLLIWHSNILFIKEAPLLRLLIGIYLFFSPFFLKILLIEFFILEFCINLIGSLTDVWILHAFSPSEVKMLEVEIRRYSVVGFLLIIFLFWEILFYGEKIFSLLFIP